MMGIIITGLLSYNFMSASTPWTGPTATPPNNNVDRPINVSADSQTKSGDLTVQNLWGNNLMYGTYVGAGAQMRSPQYCDGAGANCFSANEVVKETYSTTLHYFGTINRDTGVPKSALCVMTGSNTGGCDSGASCGISIEGETWAVHQTQYGDCDFASSCQYACTGLSSEFTMTYTYSWTVGSLSSCRVISYGCSAEEPGTQDRSVVCTRSDGSTVGDTFCPLPKPPTTVGCTVDRSHTGGCR